MCYAVVREKARGEEQEAHRAQEEAQGECLLNSVGALAATARGRPLLFGRARQYTRVITGCCSLVGNDEADRRREYHPLSPYSLLLVATVVSLPSLFTCYRTHRFTPSSRKNVSLRTITFASRGAAEIFDATRPCTLRLARRFVGEEMLELIRNMSYVFPVVISVLQSKTHRR